MNPNVCFLSKEKIQLLRKDNGWSQELLAKFAGLSIRTIQRVEKEGKCSLETHLALSSVFNLSPNELLEKHVEANTRLNLTFVLKQLVGLCLIMCLIAITISVFGQLDWFVDIVGLAFVVLFALTCTVITFGSSNLFKAFGALKFLFTLEVPHSPELQYIRFILERQIMFIYVGSFLFILIGIVTIHNNFPWQSVTAYPEELTFKMYGQKLISLIYAAIISEMFLRPVVNKLKACEIK